MDNDPIMLEPSEAEADAWAERERQRRAGWVSGPTAEERAAWTQQERERRLGRLTADPATDAPDLARRARRSLREAQLAAEGAVSLVWKGLAADGPVGMVREWSRRGLAALVRAGREWEEEYAHSGRGSVRRVPLEEDSPGARRRSSRSGS